MQNLKETLKIFAGYPQQLSRILGYTASIDAQLGAMLSKLTQSLHKPSPFVLIFIQGVKAERQKLPAPMPPITPDPTRDYGFEPYQDQRGPLVITTKPITLSVSGEVPRIFNFQPDVPIANLHIAVICDVRVVRIEDICVANNHICPSIEAAPLAYHDGIVDVANRITISTSLR